MTIAIPTKCYNCKKVIGCIVTDAREQTVRDIIGSFGLFYECKECFDCLQLELKEEIKK